MTCIIGLVDKGKVYVGGDSAAVCLDTRLSTYPKVFTLGEMIIGYTSSFRMAQILQYHVSFSPQKDKQGVWEWLVTEFAESVRRAFKEYGYIKSDEGQDEGGEFIIGYRGQLFAMYGDFQINQYRDAYNAVGSGAPYALGAMEALKDMPAKKRIKKALKIAAYFMGNVEPPFKVISK